jgi:hypothetical protein
MVASDPEEWETQLWIRDRHLQQREDQLMHQWLMVATPKLRDGQKDNCQLHCSSSRIKGELQLAINSMARVLLSDKDHRTRGEQLLELLSGSQVEAQPISIITLSPNLKFLQSM